MKCKKCGNELSNNDSFCMKCGEPVSTDNTVHKKSKKKIIIPIVAVCTILLIVVIVAISNSGNRNDNSFDNNNQSYDDYECQTTATEFSTENNTEVQEDYNPIGKETLQYPSQNDIFTYDVYETYVEITGSVKENLTGELVIPETLDNLPVRSISNRAFGGPGEAFTTPGYSISSLVLPDNLYQVSGNAFYKCKNIDSITFGNNIVTIGSMAFSHTNITSLEIPDTVVEIGSYAFSDCESLKNVVLGKSMTAVPDSMFLGCTNLSGIEWGENINTIEDSAFSHTGFTTIHLPNTITEIGAGAFSYMDNLEEFVFPDSVTKITGCFVLEHCEKLEKVTIGKGINFIPEYSFSASPSINELIIPANVTDIDSNIFGEGSFDAYARPTIYGEKGSEAAKFASSKGLEFKLIEN